MLSCILLQHCCINCFKQSSCCFSDTIFTIYGVSLILIKHINGNEKKPHLLLKPPSVQQCVKKQRLFVKIYISEMDWCRFTCLLSIYCCRISVKLHWQNLLFWSIPCCFWHCNESNNICYVDNKKNTKYEQLCPLSCVMILHWMKWAWNMCCLLHTYIHTRDKTKYESVDCIYILKSWIFVHKFLSNSQIFFVTFSPYYFVEVLSSPAPIFCRSVSSQSLFHIRNDLQR